MAIRICEASLLDQELRHLDQALQSNGYTSQEIKRALHPKRTVPETSQPPPVGFASLPYIKTVTDRIGKLLKRHNIVTSFKPTQLLRTLIRSAKDPRDPLTPAGVYRIPCSCGGVYIGTTKRSIKTRIAEHERCCRLLQPEKSALAEHSIGDPNHVINYDGTTVLSTTSQNYARLHREATEIYKHLINFNRKEEGLRLNNVWYPVLKKTTQKAPNTLTSHSSTPTVHRMSQAEADADEATPLSLPLRHNFVPREVNL
ncbi:uncharacterized protein LOC112905332 [Agrilus planipennis]|uniref:Uncharacterized protein LOC112905332 n=1 Tax=Agrilus planipennis TaxID=224129 RepID=A0A7F5RBC5_AGRPL|nr:uncharacterized protein LOC112905332 [Agrilus planipennis]